MERGGILNNKLAEFFKKKNIKFPPNKTKYLIIVALVGLLLILLGNIFTSSITEKEEENTNQPGLDEDEITEAMAKENDKDLAVEELETNFEKDLKLMLEKVNGVTDVEVMVNLDSTNVKMYEKNLISGKQLTDENDKNGGERQIEDHTEETEVVIVKIGRAHV